MASRAREGCFVWFRSLVQVGVFFFARPLVRPYRCIEVRDGSPFVRLCLEPADEIRPGTENALAGARRRRLGVSEHCRFEPVQEKLGLRRAGEIRPGVAKGMMKEGIKPHIYPLLFLQLVGDVSPPTRAAIMCFHLAAFASPLQPIPASMSILRKHRKSVKSQLRMS